MLSNRKLKILLSFIFVLNIGGISFSFAQNTSGIFLYANDVCFGATGSVQLSIETGTAPYTFQWSNGANTQNLENVLPGTYSVTVTDANGSQYVDAISFAELPYLGSQINLDITPVSCHSTNTASISISFQNNTGPYSYVWSNGASTSAINNIGAGNYTFTVTDAYACQFDTVINIAEPDTMIVDIMTSDATCFNSNDGMAWVDVSGGVPANFVPVGEEYTYAWPNGETNDTMFYHAGSFVMTVTDFVGCVVQVPFSIKSPPALYTTPVSDKQICIGGQTTLNSEVTGGEGPYWYYWINTSNNDTLFSNTWVVNPVETTSYQFYAVDRKNCTSDTLTPTVFVYPELSLDAVSVSADSICKGDSIVVEVSISGGNGGPYQIQNAITGDVFPPLFVLYPEESKSYTFRISDACETPTKTFSFDVTVMPEPKISFSVNKSENCPLGVFQFTEFSEDLGQSYYWQFGDGTVSYDKKPTHAYNEAGVYDVSLTVTSAFGCTATKIKENLVTVNPKPIADFYVSPGSVSILKPLVQFFNTSIDADSIYWFYGDGDSTTYSHINPWHKYDAVGYYNVKMIAENIHGCLDSTTRTVIVYDDYSSYTANAFTPNNDGVNDCFRFCANGIETDSFEFFVYDRWGNIVYKTETFYNNIDCNTCGEGSWDGTYSHGFYATDKLCEPGVYSWIATYKDLSGVKHTKRGLVTLIR